MDQKTITSFNDLISWQRGHQLVMLVYSLTNHFPDREMYSLVDQMRRAVMSITSNLAEGFIRPSYKEKIRFYYTSLGSLAELENQLIISRDLGYLNVDKYQMLMIKGPRKITTR